MPQSDNLYAGWTRERLVEYILGKFAFIQKPDEIGDDIGIDALCFFKEAHPTKNNLSIPGLAFNLQVKPDVNENFVQKHIHELTRLYAPFYFVLGDIESSILTVYSGLGLVALVTMVDPTVLVAGVDEGTLTITNMLVDDLPSMPLCPTDTGWAVLLYKVTELDINSTRDSPEVQLWKNDCAAQTKSIASYASGEFVIDGPVGTISQFIGIGTFTHAVARMMHASCMLAEEIHKGNRFVDPNLEDDKKLLIHLASIARHLESIKGRHIDSEYLNTIINEARWKAWRTNVLAIGESAKLEIGG